MASLILVDAQLHRNAPGPIMELLLKENILGTLLEWSLQCEEYAVPLKLEQLKIYELLFSHSHLKLWGHRVLLKPLLELVSSCKRTANVEVEKRLVVLLNQLCVSLMQDMELLNLFFRLVACDLYIAWTTDAEIVNFLCHCGSVELSQSQTFIQSIDWI
jgi:hypothetical protein